jgi:hypothetical protein
VPSPASYSSIPTASPPNRPTTSASSSPDGTTAPPGSTTSWAARTHSRSPADCARSWPTPRAPTPKPSGSGATWCAWRPASSPSSTGRLGAETNSR